MATKAKAVITVELLRRAREIHAVLDPIAKKQRTTAVLECTDAIGQRVRVLASGTRDLSPAQRALKSSGEVLASSPTAHAEVTALGHAQNNNLTPEAIAATRNFCASCIGQLRNAGASSIKKRIAVWP